MLDYIKYIIKITINQSINFRDAYSKHPAQNSYLATSYRAPTTRLSIYFLNLFLLSKGYKTHERRDTEYLSM